MVIVINYANKKFRNAQKLNRRTAIKKGKADKVICYSEKDIDDKFYQKNKHILTQKRGNGYWLWKSYIILKTLEEMNENDYLMYCDSGAFFVNKIDYLILEMKKNNDDIMCFELPFKECHYTKRDVFITMNCDEEEFYNTKQRLAGFSIFKKNAKTVNFVKEWLNYAQNEQLITDKPNILNKPNYAGFIENRHDQSIFSLLTKKYNIKPYRDPSTKINLIDYPNSNYPNIVELHRYGFANNIIFIKLCRKVFPIIMPIYKKLFKRKR